ncbi:MAG: L,D-transpeptidase family protein [Chthoniobacterales bacterium]
MRHCTALVGFFALAGVAWSETIAPSAQPTPAQSEPSAQSTSTNSPTAESAPQPAPESAPSPTPTPSPSPSPTPSISAEQAAEQARIANVNALFTAIFHNETGRVRELLAGGTNPNDVMPVPVDPSVAELFRPTVLNYFLSGERGLTPLMVAATLGSLAMAEILLQAGADPNARTKRHGTNALWLAGYKGHTDVTKLLLGVTPGSEADRMRIEVDLGAQTAQLFVDNVAEEAVPISSGRKGYPTPKGEFVVTNKHQQWRSTLYGSSMPYYLRLSCRAFGLHAGQLPGYPASHGCIRLHKKDAQNLFNRVPVGTVVVIK